MRLRMSLMLVALGLAACGGGATTATIEAGDPDLSGLILEVHQAPG